MMPTRPRLHALHVPGVDPERDKCVARLQSQADVCVHPDPDRNGVMWNWLGALDCAVENDSDLPWSLIVQDDAVPLPGWVKHVNDACLWAPEPIVSFTHLGGYGLKALENGAPYAVGTSLVWGPANAYRRDVLLDLARWARVVADKTGYRHDDYLIAAYALRSRIRIALTSRALFDLPTFRSLMNHQGANRFPRSTIVSHSGPPYFTMPQTAKVYRTLPHEVRQLAVENP